MRDQCSKWAFENILASGELSKLRAKTLSIFSESEEPLTADQARVRYSEKFGDSSYRTFHELPSRISNLTEMGFLEKFDTVECKITNQTVNRWAYTGRTEALKFEIKEECCTRCKGKGTVQKKVYLQGETKC